MTPLAKTLLITTCILLAGAGAAYAFRKKKPMQDAIKKVKKVGSIIWPAGASESEALTDSGKDFITTGDQDRYVEQLQDALNSLYTITLDINRNNCSLKWPSFNQFAPGIDGKILPVNGKFDSRTASVCQFYLNRTSVDLEFLALIKKKIAAYRSGTDKCIYPLGIAVE